MWMFDGIEIFVYVYSFVNLFLLYERIEFILKWGKGNLKMVY